MHIHIYSKLQFLCSLLLYFLKLVCSLFFPSRENQWALLALLRRGTTLAHLLQLACLFLRSVNLTFLMEFKVDVIEAVRSFKISNFATLEILMESTFFAFSPFYAFLWMFYILSRISFSMFLIIHI